MLTAIKQHVRPYQKLVVWQEAHKLCVWIYEITNAFPQKETYRLIDQMCRSAASAPTNIAEGSGKKSAKERARFYETSMCSLEELHYQCLLAHDLHYMNEEQFITADDHIRRASYLLNKLHASCL